MAYPPAPSPVTMTTCGLSSKIDAVRLRYTCWLPAASVTSNRAWDRPSASSEPEVPNSTPVVLSVDSVSAYTSARVAPGLVALMVKPMLNGLAGL
jgi:hypothetical protein